jgi:hypothetical protein
MVRAMVLNATFNTISVILWQSALFVEETGLPRESHHLPHPFEGHTKPSKGTLNRVTHYRWPLDICLINMECTVKGNKNIKVTKYKLLLNRDCH